MSTSLKMDYKAARRITYPDRFVFVSIYIQLYYFGVVSFTQMGYNINSCL